MSKRERQPFEHEIRAAEERGFQRAVDQAVSSCAKTADEPVQSAPEFDDMRREPHVAETGWIKPTRSGSRTTIGASALVNPPPEARCPGCGRSMRYTRGNGRPRAGKHMSRAYRWMCAREDCRGSELYLRDHEVWRRWGDTEKVAGIYWAIYDGRVLPHMRESMSNCPDDTWVLGPLPEPRAPVES